MSDLNDTTTVAEATPVEAETTQPDSSQVKETAVAQGAAPEVPSSMVPKEVLLKERSQRQEMQRKLAEYESKSKLSQYDPNDMEAVLAHPYVQDLLIKQAKTELTSYAKEKLDANSSIPESVKKAILSNVRGFVKESTKDVDSAKIDIDEYIDSIAEAPVTQAAPKVIPVASTTAKESASGATPMEVQAILETPLDEWTEDQARVVDDYKKTQPPHRG